MAFPQSILKWLSPLLLLLLVLTSGWEFLTYYLRPDLNMILCLILMPFVLKVRQTGVYSIRYVCWAAACFVAYWNLHMQSLFFFAIGFSVLGIVELWFGKIGWLPAALMILLSSVTAYISDVFTFGLRMHMSELTAVCLQQIGYQVEVSGNLFFLDGMTFSVDQACMGLNSIVTGLVLITLGAAYGEQRYQRSFSFWPIVCIYVLGLGLMVAGNQIRMLILVMFRSPPETLGHELIGLFCLLLYGALPIWLGMHWLLKKGLASRPWAQDSQHTFQISLRKKASISGLLILAIAWFGQHFEQYLIPLDDRVLAEAEFPDFETSRLRSGITKLENDQALVYIKPPVRVMGSDHSPHICWRGSGYVLHHVREEKIAGKLLLRAELHKDQDVLHTAWWFDNGEHQTLDQWEWRLRTLQGTAPYRLINVTVADSSQLEYWCQHFLERDWHSP